VRRVRKKLRNDRRIIALAAMYQITRQRAATADAADTVLPSLELR
jgi:hypothetical protein